MLFSRMRSAACRAAVVSFLSGVFLLGTAPAAAGVLDASWVVPTTKTDGSPLTDVSGYRIYYGSAPSPCPWSPFISIASPTTTSVPNQTVSARLTGLTAGALYYIAVAVVDTEGVQSDCSASASAVARDEFNVSPSGTVSFGSVGVGSSAEQTFTVSNMNGGTLTGSAAVPPPFTVVSGSPFTLAGVGATQAVTVRFKPTVAAIVSATIGFTANAGTVTRPVTGTGTGGSGRGSGDGVDKTPPAVAISSPGVDWIVSGILPRTAVAAANVGVIGIEFLVDGAPVGPEQLTARPTRPWTSPPPSSPPPSAPAPFAGLVAAYGFEEGGGSPSADA